MQMETKGKLIVIEGIDGSGKTLAVEYLEGIFKTTGKKVVTVKGLGTGSVGSSIREYVLADYFNESNNAVALSLALLDCNTAIKKYLEEGYIVIVDRYVGSFFAYNCVGDDDRYANILYNKILYLERIIPDTEILIDIDPKIAKERLKIRTNESNHIDQRDTGYFDIVQIGYYHYFENSASKKSVIIKNESSILDLKNQLLKALGDIHGY